MEVWLGDPAAELGEDRWSAESGVLYLPGVGCLLSGVCAAPPMATALTIREIAERFADLSPP
jgi:hypothetical protein